MPQRLPCVLRFFNCTRFSYRKASWCQSLLFYQSTYFFHKPWVNHIPQLSIHCVALTACPHCVIFDDALVSGNTESWLTMVTISHPSSYSKWHSVQQRAGTQQRYAQYVILSCTQQSYLHVYQPLILQREISSSQKQRRSSLLEGLRLWGWPRSVLELDTSCNT